MIAKAITSQSECQPRLKARPGDNVLEVQTDCTWTGEYRAGILGLDLILDTE